MATHHVHSPVRSVQGSVCSSQDSLGTAFFWICFCWHFKHFNYLVLRGGLFLILRLVLAPLKQCLEIPHISVAYSSCLWGKPCVSSSLSHTCGGRAVFGHVAKSLGSRGLLSLTPVLISSTDAFRTGTWVTHFMHRCPGIRLTAFNLLTIPEMSFLRFFLNKKSYCSLLKARKYRNVLRRKFKLPNSRPLFWDNKCG